MLDSLRGALGRLGALPGATKAGVVIAAVALALFGCAPDEGAREQAAAPETTVEERGARETTREERIRPQARETTREETVRPRTRETAGEGQAKPEAAAPEPTPPAEEGKNDRGGYDATVTVSRVVDGDTIRIRPAVDGNEQVRLIGVDTPETRDPDCGKQPYGDEATRFATSELGGQEVGLEFDAEKTDRYGRLLAYVYEDREMFNETLLEEGYAQVATFPPNVKYVDRFRAAQEEARRAGRGLWGLSAGELAAQTDRGNGIGGGGCAEERQEPEPTPDPPTRPEPKQAPTPPAGEDVDCSDFGSKAEAQPYLLPGDPHGLDRDGDGTACDSLR